MLKGGGNEGGGKHKKRDKRSSVDCEKLFDRA